MSLTTSLALAGAALNGLLAGASLDQTVKQVPSRHRTGVKAYAVYVRGADLGAGLAWYALLANAAVVATLSAAITAWRSGARELGALVLAAALAVAHTLTTLRAAPTLLASRHVPLTDERSLAKIFDRFARWQGLRMCLQVLTFAASLWAAAGALRR